MATLNRRDRGPAVAAGARAVKRLPRGSAAMEFVFVAPLLFVLLAAVTSFGLAILARYRIYGLAQAAVRDCVAVADTGWSAGLLQSCASSQFSTFAARVRTGCDTTPTVTPQVTPVNMTTINGSAAGTSTQLVLLQLEVSCNMNVNGIINYFPGSIVPRQIPIYANVAMPMALSR